MFDERGVIKYTKRAEQLVLFEGIQYGTITPTDIDAMIEYRNLAYVFMEVKHVDKKIEVGQEIALRRMVDDANKASKRAVAFVLEHDTRENEPLYLANCTVRNTYFNSRIGWSEQHKGMRAKDAIDNFIKWVDRTKREGSQQ